MQHRVQPFCRRCRPWPGSRVAATAVSPVSLSSLQLSTAAQCIHTPLDLSHNALLAADAVTSPILPAM